MSSPFAPHAGALPVAPASHGLSATTSSGGAGGAAPASGASPFVQNGSVVQAQGRSSIYGGTPSLGDPLGSLPNMSFSPSFSAELNSMLLAGKIPSLSGGPGSGSFGFPSPAGSMHLPQMAPTSSGAPSYAAVAASPSGPTYMVNVPAGYMVALPPASTARAPPPIFHLDPDQSKRTRSSGLTNMMVVPDGKAQRTKSGQQQHGPMVVALGRTAAPHPSPPPTPDVPKEVKSHTARSLLRMLRAGTGIKTSNNIPIVEAETFVKQLAGEYAPVDILKAKKRNAGREALSVLLTLYIQKPVTMHQAAMCFHNPTNRGLEPTETLWELIGDRTWPPCPEDKDGKGARRPKELPASLQSQNKLAASKAAAIAGKHTAPNQPVMAIPLPSHDPQLSTLLSPFAMPDTHTHAAPSSAPLASPFAVPESRIQAPLLPQDQLLQRGLPPAADTHTMFTPVPSPAMAPDVRPARSTMHGLPVAGTMAPSRPQYAPVPASMGGQVTLHHAPYHGSPVLSAPAQPVTAGSVSLTQVSSHSITSQDSLGATSAQAYSHPHTHSTAFGSPAPSSSPSPHIRDAAHSHPYHHGTASPDVTSPAQRAGTASPEEADRSEESEGPFSSMAGPIKSTTSTEATSLATQRRDESLSGMLASASMDLGHPHRNSTLSGPTLSGMFGNIDSSWPNRNETLSGILGSDGHHLMAPGSTAMSGPSLSGFLGLHDHDVFHDADREAAHLEQARQSAT